MIDCDDDGNDDRHKAADHDLGDDDDNIKNGGNHGL